MSSFYTHHVFFCTNRREPDATGQARPCCAQANADKARDYVKTRIKALKRSGPGAIRVNNAGCLDRCEQGPCLVVYPQAVWYTYVDDSDLEEIIQEHLLNGRIVQRLQLPDAA
jgi:(2Fe-2S) ferredoxin